MSCRERVGEELYIVYVNYDTREMFERSRSGYCDLKGFQVDLSAQIFGGRLMCLLTGKMFENIFSRTHYWRFA